MSATEYPLKQIIEVKQKRVEAAEKVVKERQLVLKAEKKKLEEREAERDKVKNHKKDKLQQLRDIVDAGTTSPKIQQMKGYLKLVDEKLLIEEKKVRDQTGIVTNAEKQLEAAELELHQKRQEADKLLMHQKDWEREQRKEAEIIEGREQDELGSMIYTSRNRKK